MHNLLTRVRASVSRAFARVLALARPRAETRRLGMSGRGRVGNPGAAGQLDMMGSSPAIYAALWHRCIGLQVYPWTVYVGEPGGRTRRPLSPTEAPWVGDLLRLLQRPDPADIGRVFPQTPGEKLFAQVKADLLMTGTAWVRMQEGEPGRPIGLARLHPAVTSLEAFEGKLMVHYRPGFSQVQRFPVEQVCRITTLSAAADMRAELGIGAAAPLEAITRAEVAALDRTATAIEQGGVDLMIEPTTPDAGAMMMDPTTRGQVLAEATDALSKPGQRVIALSGGYKLTELGLKPTDLRGPETMAAAKEAQLMVLGVTPVMLGADQAAYATAAAQLRVQYSMDLELVTWLEVHLLRPLAQAFARQAGGRWAAQASLVTCTYDLSTHPGALAARSEAIDRATRVQGMGWTAAQAAAAEQLDLPEPEGQPMAVQPFGVPPSAQAPAQNGGTPRPAAGVETPRTLGDLLGRAVEPPAPDVAAEARALAWRQQEEARVRVEVDMRAAARRALDQDRARYEAELRALLERAWTGDGYSSLNLERLGAPDAGPYVEHLGAPWLQIWDDGAAGALPDDLEVPAARSDVATLDALQPSAGVMAGTTRSWTIEAAAEAAARGLAPADVLADVRASRAYDPARDLMIARTETVRAQSEGVAARYGVAAEAGIQLEQEWLAARNGDTRDSHRAMDGQRAPVGGVFRFPSGVEARGPGLSGDPGEDINCRCAVRAVVV